MGAIRGEVRTRNEPTVGLNAATSWQRVAMFVVAVIVVITSLIVVVVVTQHSVPAQLHVDVITPGPVERLVAPAAPSNRVGTPARAAQPLYLL